MKKIILILSLLLLLTGCTAVRINTNSIENITKVILSKNNNLYNTVGKGYKYYVPKGVNYIDTNEYNEKLYSNGVYYYLYVDVVSYYYKKTFVYEKSTNDESVYYDEFLDSNGKKGYILITEQTDKRYLIEYMYNYAKIEALVNYDNINEVILNSTYMLSTMKYNSNVIKLMLEEDFLTNREKKYDIFKPKKEVIKFLEYSEEE